jgi:hypothetical protein
MTDKDDHSEANEDRRKFLVRCGKFAAVTPPAITLLLSTSLNSPAVAKSGGGDNSGSGGRDSGDRDRDSGDRDGGGRWWGPPDSPGHRRSF